ILFFLKSIVGNLFGESYYPMIAEKVETSTGFNTLLLYLAYITPVFSVIFALYLVIRLLLKPKLKDFMFKYQKDLNTSSDLFYIYKPLFDLFQDFLQLLIQINQDILINILLLIFL